MARIAHGGRTNQGQPLGVLMLDTRFPRVPGDVGNGFTFDFPVRYLTVKGASVDRVVREGDPALLAPFIEGARELEAAGCQVIATSCGFLVMFQKEMAAAVGVQVITSSLLQVPFLARMLGPGRKVGILTIRATSLGEKHFRGAGMEGCEVVIRGMEEYSEFTNAFFQDQPVLDLDRAEAEVAAAARALAQSDPSVGALVLECTNMPPFARAAQEAAGLPVYDVTTLINHTVSGLLRRPFHRL